MDIKELLMNEQNLKVIAAVGMASTVYTGIKFIEKGFNKKAADRIKLREMQKREEQRKIDREEKKRIASYFNVASSRKSFEGLDRDHWVENGRVKKLNLDFMKITNKNATEVGA